LIRLTYGLRWAGGGTRSAPWRTSSVAVRAAWPGRDRNDSSYVPARGKVLFQRHTLMIRRKDVPLLLCHPHHPIRLLFQAVAVDLEVIRTTIQYVHQFDALRRGTHRIDHGAPHLRFPIPLEALGRVFLLGRGLAIVNRLGRQAEDLLSFGRHEQSRMQEKAPPTTISCGTQLGNVAVNPKVQFRGVTQHQISARPPLTCLLPMRLGHGLERYPILIQQPIGRLQVGPGFRLFREAA
jgi:hypothetical protein